MIQYSAEIQGYNNNLGDSDKAIANLLAQAITENLPGAEHKIWHAHPVWFLEGNPIVGYSKLKDNVKLMFLSGQSFDEAGLNLHVAKFKDASIGYNDVSEINLDNLKRWLLKSADIQWDYKNIVKRKGVLERLK
ncbi:DUF1801 domain-containing protein [Flavobacterium sp. MFBS3-15]|uniref:DUF1801 domain-containing protein n=1 Tax=Flavobacterium sp. MFBS3-15 TaxID=2989816 RepID=UPI00223689F1|nr:DUF1801 domain-containing protein [Flavobacterium sp. MFBS3-15]MCW4469225.1 DUF1801 domain-containing protein [Flavobacterium sp. MFBS3-15]